MNKGTAVVGFILSFIIGLMVMWGIQQKGLNFGSKEAGASGSISRGKVNPGAVRVEMYVMSQCPYGVQAVNGMKESLQKLGADVDFVIDFIGDAKPDGSLSSMHGDKEVKGDIAQLCAAKLSPAKYLDMIFCQNENSREVDTNWESCATKAGIDAKKLGACISGEEGKSLLKASFDRSKAKGAQGSPTIYIGGKAYQGQRRPGDYMRAICAEYKTKPAACNAIPDQPKVNVTILNDKRCADCDSSRAVGMLKQRVGNPVIKTLDYSDPEGRKLYDEIKPGTVPVLIFDNTLDADKDAAAGFARGIKTSGAWRFLNMGQDWNPACANDGACDTAECKDSLGCRKESPNKLEVFVMAQCPFGVKGLDAMQEVVKNFGDKLDFQVHYIGSGDAKGGLTSMHGQGEVDEDLREICAYKHSPKKFMEYVWCRNKDIRSADWKSCATDKTGVDAKVIEKCSTGDEGKKLLEDSFKIASSAGIGASPTWLVNGKFKFSGIDAESIRKNICDHNQGLKGCENKLTAAPQGGAPAGGCGK